MRKSNRIAARYARQIRAGILFADLCRENALLIEHARAILTPLGHEAFVREMIKDGHHRVGGLPPI